MADKVLVAPTVSALNKKAAEIFVETARQAIQERGTFSVALSGGSTPRDIYALLAKKPFSARLDWSRFFIFWGDERGVPPSHPESNFKMAWKAWLSRVPVPMTHIFRMPAEIRPIHKAAAAYEKILKKFFGRKNPSFDLSLMGVGEDGHTASLFPGSPALREKRCWVKGVKKTGPGSYRMSLTFPIINRSRKILIVCAGRKKSSIVSRIFSQEESIRDVPILGIRPMAGDKIWLMDKSAAQRIVLKSDK